MRLAHAAQKREAISACSGVNKDSRVHVWVCKRFGNQMMLDKDLEIEKPEERVVEHEFANPDMQEARAFLRERFLRVVTGIVGKRAEFHLHENSKVAGEFRGCDVDGLEVYVRNLETPLGKVPESILRSTDIIHFEVDGVSVKR